MVGYDDNELVEFGATYSEAYDFVSQLDFEGC
jgi:hypothetical protein